MERLRVLAAITEAQEWIKRIKRGLHYERQYRADPREVDMLIESLEAELRRLAQLASQE